MVAITWGSASKDTITASPNGNINDVLINSYVTTTGTNTSGSATFPTGGYSATWPTWVYNIDSEKVIMSDSDQVINALFTLHPKLKKKYKTPEALRTALLSAAEAKRGQDNLRELGELLY